MNRISHSIFIFLLGATALIAEETTPPSAEQTPTPPAAAAPEAQPATPSKPSGAPQSLNSGASIQTKNETRVEGSQILSTSFSIEKGSASDTLLENVVKLEK